MSQDYHRRRVLTGLCLSLIVLSASGCGSSTSATAQSSDETTAPPAVQSPATSAVQSGEQTADAVPDKAQFEQTAPQTELAQNRPAQANPLKRAAGRLLGRDPARDEVHAAIDAAIGRLKSGDIRGFFEHDVPIESLLRLRRSESMEEEVAAFAAEKDSHAIVIKRLEVVRYIDPEFQRSGTLAVFVIPPPKPDGSAEEPEPVKGLPDPETTNVRLNGFGSDLKAVLSRAINTLEQGDLDAFVQHMFPAGELRRPDAAQRTSKLVARLKANPDMVQQMLDDLKTVQGFSPAYQEGRKLAVFKVAGGTMKVGPRLEVKLPERIFKFQNVEGSWRLFDNTTEIRQVIATTSRLEPLPTKFDPNSRSGPPTVVMEKFGNCWRFVSFGNDLRL